ncbi:MAG: serine hydrolase, partial [Lachnospiraceae bacterium]|nr:serine hydrolase [Lachnospiraceae bacterium]
IIKENLLGPASLKDIENTMGRKGYGYGVGMQVLMKPRVIKTKAPKGVFGWDGAAGSCIIMDTKSKLSLVYTQHVRNCGLAYGEIHPRLREFLFE